MYSIGEVSEMFDLPVSTLRYYDKEGLFPDMMRVSGIRKFSDRELETLRVIECLKKSGMEIKDIRQFIEWCAMGKETYPQRRAMFQRQRQNIEAEIERMNQALDMLKYKCWFYDQAMKGVSEDQLHAMIPDSMPEEIQVAPTKQNPHNFLFISSTKAILRDHGSNPSVWLLLWQNFDLLIKYVTYMCLNI